MPRVRNHSHHTITLAEAVGKQVLQVESGTSRIAQGQTPRNLDLPPRARRHRLRRGASAWGEDQVGFLEQVGGWASDAGSWIVDQGEDLVDWYSDLPMFGKVFPGIYAAGVGIDAGGDALEEAGEEIQRLWAQREALFAFFKALYEQSVNAVQVTIETLAGMGGELGELMQAMWDRGAEWVQGLIEMCRESEVLQGIFASVGALFAALPPNLWAEGIGTGVGYIVPELLISVVLAILAAISAGAGAAALAARLLGQTAQGLIPTRPAGACAARHL